MDMNRTQKSGEKPSGSLAEESTGLDAAEHGIWDWDVTTGVANLSPAYWQLTGYEPGELPTNMDFLKRLVHPDDWFRVADTLGRLVHSGEQEFVIEYRMVTKGGEVRRVHGKGTVLERDAAGAVVRLAGSISAAPQGRQQGE